jgi:hypothetical protein
LKSAKTLYGISFIRFSSRADKTFNIAATMEGSTAQFMNKSAYSIGNLGFQNVV